jgi:asparagine synthase (glutamine-hydrolysing)
MCGIAGIISRTELDVRALAAMGDAMVHRGPDGEGFLVSDLRSPLEMTRRPEPLTGAGPTVGLAHRRLSIIDLSTSNDQPLVDEAGELAIVLNGEIYNYRELRAELERSGHGFRTTGDTEVALRAYAEWGVNCVQRFIGMWAFAILDRRERRLVLSRDRFGIKPLYWAIAGERLLFASDIKALLASGMVRAEPHEETMAGYLATGRVELGDKTFLAGIRRLPAASTAVLALDGASLEPRSQQYWSLPRPECSWERADAAAAVRAALEDSLRLHLRSDVPVGTCLSGGIDSSGIVAVSDTLRGSDVDETFTHAAFGYVPPEHEHSEQRYMVAVAEQYGAELTVVEPGREELLSALPEVIAAQDEPFGSASIAAQWFVFGAARRAGIKVILDGQGADEVFGGYHHYLRLISEDLVMSGRPLAYTRFARACRASVGVSPHPAMFVAGALLPRPLRNTASRALVEVRARRAATRALRYPHVAPELRALALDHAKPLRLDADAMLRADVEEQNLPGLLRYEDRNSMAHSIEARVPYLDHRLVELAFRMPALDRMGDAVPKRVLRDALRDVLPKVVMDRRDKIGFRASPSATWELARRHREALIDAQCEPEERWFVPGEVERLIDSPARNAEVEFALWRVINAKLWARRIWGG